MCKGVRNYQEALVQMSVHRSVRVPPLKHATPHRVDPLPMARVIGRWRLATGGSPSRRVASIATPSSVRGVGTERAGVPAESWGDSVVRAIPAKNHRFTRAASAAHDTGSPMRHSDIGSNRSASTTVHLLHLPCAAGNRQPGPRTHSGPRVAHESRQKPSISM